MSERGDYIRCERCLKDAINCTCVPLAEPMCYILMGSCGEYADIQTWNVRVYLDKNKAYEDLEKAEKEAQDLMDSGEDYYDITDEMLKSLTVDPYARFDYTGIDYRIGMVQLEEGKDNGR